jgi:hypothetical protein
VHRHDADPARPMVGLTSHDNAAEWKRLKPSAVEFIADPTIYINL